MDRTVRLGLAARALVAAGIHATVLVPVGLFWVALLAVLSFLLVSSLLAAVDPVLPDEVLGWLALLGTGVVTASGLYGVGKRVRSRLRDPRERLLDGVVPVGDEDDPGARRLADAGPDGEHVLAGADRRRFAETVRRLAAQAGVPAPTPCVHPGEAPLCYTVHHDGHSFLVVSRGLVEALPPAEFEAVLAHEVAHLANGDHRFMTWATVPLVAVEHLSDDWGEAGDERDDGWDDYDPVELDFGRQEWFWIGVLVAIHLLALEFVLALAGMAGLAIWVAVAIGVLLLLGGVLAVLATAGMAIAVWLVVIGYRALLAWAELGTGLFSRGRELAADRAAARLTGDPAALAAALRRLDASLGGPPPSDLRDLPHTRDALNVVPALDPERDGSGGLLATHPPTSARVERLRELEREYETA